MPDTNGQPTTMLERVALHSYRVWRQSQHDPQAMTRTFKDMTAAELKFAIPHAREMIEVMREPTAEMCAAGAETFLTGEGMKLSVENQPAASWRTMIDAAKAD